MNKKINSFSLPDPFTLYIYTDIEFKIKDCNSTFLAHMGYTHKEEAYGKTIENFNWHTFAPSLLQQNKDALAGKFYTLLIFLPHATLGPGIFAAWKLTDIDQDNKVIGLHCFYTKIILRQPTYPSFLAQITGREALCLIYLARGESAKAIAKRMHVSPRTVETYIHHLKKKLRCNSRDQLIETAIKQGLFQLITAIQ